MITFSVKNFDKFQHYKDRAPPWIKLYNELLDDYEFGSLPDASKMHLIAIWLLASRSNNKIPFDTKWVAKRINANSAVDLQLLADNGFIVLDQQLHNAEQDASTTIAECLPRERGEKEESREEKTFVAKAPRTSDDFEELKRIYPKRSGNYGWKAAEKKFNALVKTGVDPKAIIAAAIKLGQTLRSRIGTEFIPMPPSWLNSEDFAEIAADAFEETAPTIDWDGQLSRFSKGFAWSAKWYGPEPGHPGCRAPADLLTKYGLGSVDGLDAVIPTSALRPMQ